MTEVPSLNIEVLLNRLSRCLASSLPELPIDVGLHVHQTQNRDHNINFTVGTKQLTWGNDFWPLLLWAEFESVKVFGLVYTIEPLTGELHGSNP